MGMQILSMKASEKVIVQLILTSTFICSFLRQKKIELNKYEILFQRKLLGHDINIKKKKKSQVKKKNYNI